MSSPTPPPESRKRVLIISEHFSDRYSGGRYHAWMMGEALAATGHEVTVWTNTTPFLARDFKAFPADADIRLHLDPSFSRSPPSPFDVIVLVPHLSGDWAPFVAAVAAARDTNSPLVFLDFEAPSWYNETNTPRRSLLRVLAWWATSRYADVILSSTAFGSKKARAYYRPLRFEEAFRYCPPAINSLAADSIETPRKKQIICITRFDRSSRHKGIASLASIINEELRGYRLMVIGKVAEDVAMQLHAEGDRCGVEVIFRSNLTDQEKFLEIKRSRLMTAPSEFEGFGYPPAEALYCGVPCVANRLDVYHETAGDGLIYIPRDGTLGETVRRAIRENIEVSEQARARISDVVKFERYSARLKTLMSELTSASNFQAAARLRPWWDVKIFLFVGGLAGKIHRQIRIFKDRVIQSRRIT
jgi:glycosyltransferase involved in cell wall biosynthesis